MVDYVCPNCGKSHADAAISSRPHCLYCVDNNIHAHVVSKYDDITKDNIIEKLKETEKHPWCVKGEDGYSKKSFLFKQGILGDGG